MLFKRIINIALIFTLLLAVVGVSSSKTYCNAIQEVVSGDCCSDVPDDEQSCCIDMDVFQRLETDLSATNASVSVPDILLFAVAYVRTFLLPEAVLQEHHGFSTYRSPLITKDISVLHQVFRI